MRILHLTDPHLSTLEGISFANLLGKRWSGYLSWRRKRRWQHRRETLDQLTAAATAEDADVVVVTGDLAHIGLDSELQQVGDWLRSLGPPNRVVVIPGNHDLYHKSSWRAAAANWGPYLHLSNLNSEVDNRDCYPGRLDVGHLSFISASSALPTPLFSATGRLGTGQLQRLGHALDDSRKASHFCCLLIHHPPLPGMIEWRKALSDAKQLLPVLENHQADLILHGHNHRNTAAVVGDTRIFSTTSASSTIPARPASYRVFDVERKPGAWSVAMQLKQLHPQANETRTCETDQWLVEARQPDAN